LSEERDRERTRREGKDEGRVIKVAYRSLLSLPIGRVLEHEKKKCRTHFRWQLSFESNSLKCSERRKQITNALNTHRTGRNTNTPYCSLFPDSGNGRATGMMMMMKILEISSSITRADQIVRGQSSSLIDLIGIERFDLTSHRRSNGDLFQRVRSLSL
jgi:hypothetical protein